MNPGVWGSEIPSQTEPEGMQKHRNPPCAGQSLRAVLERLETAAVEEEEEEEKECGGDETTSLYLPVLTTCMKPELCSGGPGGALFLGPHSSRESRRPEKLGRAPWDPVLIHSPAARAGRVPEQNLARGSLLMEDPVVRRAARSPAHRALPRAQLRQLHRDVSCLHRGKAKHTSRGTACPQQPRVLPECKPKLPSSPRV